MTCFKLRLEDCIKGMRSMGASTVDIVVTSPPYNIGVDYGAYQDSKSTEEYLSWCKSHGEGQHRVCRGYTHVQKERPVRLQQAGHL